MSFIQTTLKFCTSTSTLICPYVLSWNLNLIGDILPLVSHVAIHSILSLHTFILSSPTFRIARTNVLLNGKKYIPNEYSYFILDDTTGEYVKYFTSMSSNIERLKFKAEEYHIYTFNLF